MEDAAKLLFNSITKYSDLSNLILNGETESIYLECKSPSAPNLSRDMKCTIAKALSGFSNTAGGIIIWGISTTKHVHGGLDVLTQIEPIGKCKYLLDQFNKVIPTLSTPPITIFDNKIIIEKKNDEKGVIITYIPKLESDPVQSNEDNLFYYRSGDDFTVAPYEMVKRLFSATRCPDLMIESAEINKELVLTKDGCFEIPITIRNRSSAIGEHVQISLEITDADQCDNVFTHAFTDISHLNEGKLMYSTCINNVIHKGFGLYLGKLYVKLNQNIRNHKHFIMASTIYANNMQARVFTFSFKLSLKKGYLYKVNELKIE